MAERIQKLLATLGVASRREIESMITGGRIEVNGRPAELGQKISPEDKVRVDGRVVALSPPQEPARVLLYKKRVGEVVTRDDPEGRRTIFRKLPELKSGRWIAVGRLDLNTSGLLLLTNHGELARRLTHPSFEIARRYAVRVLGEVSDEVLERLRRGVKLDDGEARFESITRTANEDGDGANQWFEVMLREGRNREVRRLFESQGLQVSRLIRVAYGPLELGRGIRSGSYRESTPQELQALFDAVGLAELAKPKSTRRSPRHDPDSEVPFQAKKLARATGKKARHAPPPSRGRAAAAPKGPPRAAGVAKPAAGSRAGKSGTATAGARTAKPGTAKPGRAARADTPRPARAGGASKAAMPRPARAGGAGKTDTPRPARSGGASRTDSPRPARAGGAGKAAALGGGRAGKPGGGRATKSGAGAKRPAGRARTPGR